MNENDNPRGEIQDTKQQRDAEKALGRSYERESQGSSRISVRFVSLRWRLLDEDNLTGGCKGLLDGLRYAGLIPNDSPDKISFFATQERIDKDQEEKTIIEIIYP